MTRFQSFLSITICLAALGFGFSSPAFSQENTPLTVSEAFLCLDVVDLSCMGENDQFPVEVGKIYCFTRILGAQSPTTITHVWYYKDVEVARIALSVNSPNWRTYSSKKIGHSQIGEWHVDILGLQDELLREIIFNVTPQ